MSIWHYDDTALPAGIAVRMNGSKTSYELALFDGAIHSDQYPDEPETGVLFESPDGARRWLEAATAVLTPYIESGDQSARLPNPSGWSIWDESDEEPTV